MHPSLGYLADYGKPASLNRDKIMSNSISNQAVHSRQSGWQSDGALIALALMWGTSHVITKEILATHSPAFYTSLRFGLAALCFGLAFAGHLRRSNWREIRQGILLGLLSFIGIAFYVLGLNFTQASKAGFITGLYLVFTPLIGFVLFRSQPTRDHLTGWVVAIFGFILLSLPHGGEGINWGDVLVLLAAVAWAAHIAATSAFATGGDVRTLASVQVMTVAALALIGPGSGAFAQDKMLVSLISKGFQHQFWQAVKAGADAVKDAAAAVKDAAAATKAAVEKK